MAALALSMNHLRVNQNSIEIGTHEVPFEKIDTMQIRRKDFSGKEIHEVRLWTQGGMGCKGRVLLDVQLETAERTNEFVKGLLERAGASFSLYAKSIKPDVIPTDSGVYQGVIDIEFQEEHYCEEFDAAIASTFFPGFEKTVLRGTVLRLTSQEGTAERTIQIMNNAFAALNKQTHLQTAEYLRNNRDPRFHAARSREPEAVAHPSRDPHYYLSRAGVQKERAHLGAPPAGHIRAWDESDHLYYAPVPLEECTLEAKASTRKNLLFLIDYVKAISGVSAKFSSAMAPLIQKLEACVAPGKPRNAVDLEVMKNLIEYPPLFQSEDLTEVELTRIDAISKEFLERQEKLSQEEASPKQEAN